MMCMTILSYCRTETIFSGLIIRPDPDNSKSTKVSMLIQIDAKGLLPKFAVNYGMTKASEKWRDALEKYYKEVSSR